MAVSVSPNQDDINVALRAFLTGILPAGVKVVLGQVNRVPEPEDTDYVVMTMMRQDRISTNVDAYVDAVFTASIAGTLMTVSSISVGEVEVGHQVFGTGLASGTTTVTGFVGGVGGTGTYRVSPSQTAAPQKMAAGAATFLQPNKITMQLDVHGPSGADNSTVISTLFRDAYAAEQFAALNEDIAPLYADDPRQMPFQNAEQQYEDRWIVEAVLQANQTVTGIPQQFADAITVTVIEVDATYPP